MNDLMLKFSIRQLAEKIKTLGFVRQPADWDLKIAAPVKADND